MCVYSTALYVYMFVQYQEYWTTYPAPEHTVQVSSESVHDLHVGVAPGYVTIQTESFWDYLNWIIHLRPPPVYTIVYYHCIDNWPAKHRMVISHLANVTMYQVHVNTDGNSCTLHHWAGLNMTTIPLCLECVLSLSDDLA